MVPKWSLAAKLHSQVVPEWSLAAKLHSEMVPEWSPAQLQSSVVSKCPSPSCSKCPKVPKLYAKLCDFCQAGCRREGKSWAFFASQGADAGEITGVLRKPECKRRGNHGRFPPARVQVLGNHGCFSPARVQVKPSRICRSQVASPFGIAASGQTGMLWRSASSAVAARADFLAQGRRDRVE